MRGERVVVKSLLPCIVQLCVAVSSPLAWAQATLPLNFEDHLIVGGLSTPTGMAALPDGRVLVTEQLTARIRLIVNGALAAVDPVVTVPGVRNDDFFRGLLGIAVDPRWPASPYVYVHYAAANGKVMISRFTVAGDLAFTGSGALTISPATRYDLFNDLYDAAHNGGTLRFGPDHMLYASVGDSIHSSCSAQNLATLRGVILRLEVRNLPSGPGGPPARSLITPPDNPFAGNSNLNARLVWARGLRNPFRFQIDPAGGALYITDVGESAWEEIDRADAGGLDFGWPLFEGPAAFMSCPGVSGTGLTLPIHAYADGHSGISAGVYHRPASLTQGFPREYEGDYFFSDYYNGALRRLKGSGATWARAPAVPGQPDSIDWATGLDEVSDYMMATDGSLWYCRQGVDFTDSTGEIRRIAYAGVLAVEDGSRGGIGLLPPHPSPTTSGVDFGYSLPARATPELIVFDLAGREILRLEAGTEREAGMHRLHWDLRDSDGRRVPPGVYLARLQWDRGTSTRRLVIVQ